MSTFERKFHRLSVSLSRLDSLSRRRDHRSQSVRGIQRRRSDLSFEQPEQHDEFVEIFDAFDFGLDDRQSRRNENRTTNLFARIVAQSSTDKTRR